jgi:hypothetical protein
LAKRKQPKPAPAVPVHKEPAAPTPTRLRGTPPRTAAVAVPSDRKFTFLEYLILNAIFDAFCLAQLVLVRLFLKETRGLYYFFALLMIGFLLVSIFDYFYDRLAPRDEPVAQP